jgi:membrane protease YdiL (CAAX protease family)
LGFLLFIVLISIFYAVILYGWSIFGHSSFLNNQKITIILLFGSFITWHLALLTIVKLLHKRSYVSLIGVKKKLNWKQFLLATFVTVSVSLVSLIIIPFESILFSQNYLPRIETSYIKEWLPWVLPALLVIFIQVSAEEVLFRGYLLQQLRARFRSYWIWAIIPSFLFGIAHYDFSTFENNTFIYMLNAFVFGVLASILTVQSNNISYALGMHFINNIIGVLFFGLGDTLSDLSLVKSYFDKTGVYMTYIIILQTALQIITFLILLNWLKRHKNKAEF